MPHTMVDAEVLVCGAGPVGLACAFLLAEALNLERAERKAEAA